MGHRLLDAGEERSVTAVSGAGRSTGLTPLPPLIRGNKVRRVGVIPP